MPVNQSVWQLGDRPVELSETRLHSEEELEEHIVAAPRILNDQWMLIGRQVPTAHGGFVDLLAVDPDGSLIVVELKKNRTPREVVAQALDYAAWAQHLASDAIASIYERWTNGRSLTEAYREFFGQDLDEDSLNNDHQIVIVASELDSSTERIVRYLADTAGLAVTVLFFRIVTDGAQRFLSRAWLIEPQEIEASTPSRGRGAAKQPWNGEYYVSFGGGHDPKTQRNWHDARRFGFISGGGKPWYSRTLFQLSEGDRVWVNMPGNGYVGVGRVSAPARRADQVQTEDGYRLIENPELTADWSDQPQVDDDHAEYVVGIDWIYPSVA